MNKIVSVVLVILQSAFLACCNGCNQSPPPSYHEVPVKDAPPKELVVDTVSEVKQADEEKKDAPVSPASSSVSTSRSTSSYGSSSSYSHGEKELDNMRGFDPASEDDMNDNGMSRYMENNDEEGWD